MVVKLQIVLVIGGKMDKSRTCVITREILRGVMALKVHTMMITLRKIGRTHLVIAIIGKEHFFLYGMVLAIW